MDSAERAVAFQPFLRALKPSVAAGVQAGTVLGVAVVARGDAAVLDGPGRVGDAQKVGSETHGTRRNPRALTRLATITGVAGVCDFRNRALRTLGGCYIAQDVTVVAAPVDDTTAPQTSHVRLTDPLRVTGRLVAGRATADLRRTRRYGPTAAAVLKQLAVISRDALTP